MNRELRRFTVKDAAGRLITVAEVAALLHIDGVEIMDGVPMLLTAGGTEVVPTGVRGEYRLGGLAARYVEPECSTPLGSRASRPGL